MHRLRHVGASCLLLVWAVVAAPLQAEEETLLDVYEQAISADPELRGMALEVQALEADERAALGGLLPSVTLSGEVRYTNRDEERVSQLEPGGESRSRSFTQQQYILALTQPLFDRPAWHRWRGERIRKDAGAVDREQRLQTMAAEVVEAYFGVLSAQEGVRLYSRELEAVDASRQQAEALYEEREIALGELERARSRYDRVHAALLRARNEVEVALERLSRLTGERHSTLAGLDRSAQLPQLGPEDSDEWFEQARRSNPEIIAARLRTNAEQRSVQAARSERLPRIDAVAGYSHFDDVADVDMDDPGRAELDARELDEIYVGVQLQMPLYEGGALSARSTAAARRAERQRAELTRIERSVRLELRSAYQGVQSGRSEIRAYEAAVRSGERTLEAMQAEFEAGTRGITDVLEAQRELYEARRDLIEARHQYLMDVAEVHRVAGLLSRGQIVAFDALLNGVEISSEPVEIPTP